MADLFDHYPRTPGFKEPTTSADAAQSMEKTAPKLRDKCKAALKAGPATADELAERMGLSILSIRPRVTELAQLGAIEKTGERRKNGSGRAAHVWRLAA